MTLSTYEDDLLYMYHASDPLPDPANFTMHIHQKCEICYFMSGRGYYSIEGNTYEPFPGSVLLTRNAETHMLHVDPSAAYERFVIRFTPEELFEENKEIVSLFRDRKLGHENMIICSSDSLTFIQECYKRLERAVTASASKAEIYSYVRLILFELLYAKENNEQSQISYKNNVDKLVSDIIAYINLHLTDISSLDFIEQNFYFSRSYINRVFKKTTGSTIWDYIIVKRLMLVRSLILAGEPAGAASGKCGFSDYSSFFRQYKAHFGIAPTETKAETATVPDGQ